MSGQYHVELRPRSLKYYTMESRHKTLRNVLLYPRKRKCAAQNEMSASLIGRFGSSALRLSHHSSVDVACGLVLLFGLGAKALPVWDSRMRGTIFGSALPSNAAGPSGHAISPHPSSRKGHHSTARWSSRFLLSIVILCCHAAAASCRLQRNSVPSTQIRCMITASRRASATIAFFLPRRLAICIAQALSQDHFVERTSMT